MCIISKSYLECLIIFCFVFSQFLIEVPYHGEMVHALVIPDIIESLNSTGKVCLVMFYDNVVHSIYTDTE